jgi:hypothetical protein
MFAWYQNAEVCYVYLSDVSAQMDSFATARWFSRGWTLQELIAPSKVDFYARDWVRIGSKRSLSKLLEEITKIHSSFLTGEESIKETSIAERMSWASRRQTSRPEDMAYCLMGLFSVNMPMLYGEGERAFIRLQEEIIKVSDDHSIFAWRSFRKDESYESSGGLLATHPSLSDTLQKYNRIILCLSENTYPNQHMGHLR